MHKTESTSIEGFQHQQKIQMDGAYNASRNWWHFQDVDFEYSFQQSLRRNPLINIEKKKEKLLDLRNVGSWKHVLWENNIKFQPNKVEPNAEYFLYKKCFMLKLLLPMKIYLRNRNIKVFFETSILWWFFFYNLPGWKYSISHRSCFYDVPIKRTNLIFGDLIEFLIRINFMLSILTIQRYQNQTY